MFKNREKLRKHALSENDENKIKKKREKLRNQTKSHLNVKYKSVLKDDLKKDANQTI